MSRRASRSSMRSFRSWTVSMKPTVFARCKSWLIFPPIRRMCSSFYFEFVLATHQNTEIGSVLWSLHFIRPRPLSAGKEIIRRSIASRVHGNLTPAGFSASSVEKYHCPKAFHCHAWSNQAFGCDPDSLSTLLSAISLSSRWVSAYHTSGWGFRLHFGMYLMNGYSVFKVPEGALARITPSLIGNKGAIL